MKALQILKNINSYILNPKYNVSKKQSKKEKVEIIIVALFYCLAFSFLVAIPMYKLIHKNILPLKPQMIEVPFTIIFF